MQKVEKFIITLYISKKNFPDTDSQKFFQFFPVIFLLTY